MVTENEKKENEHVLKVSIKSYNNHRLILTIIYKCVYIYIYIYKV